MSNVNTLKNTRKSTKKSITSIEKFVLDISNPDEDTIEALNVREDRINELWKDYDAIQSQLEILLPDDTQIEADRERVETQYLNIKAKIKRLQKIYYSKKEREDKTIDQDQNTGKVKLPKLKIPVFDGKYENWKQFYDSFISLIDKNTSLSNIEKLIYLQSSLEGEALTVITSESISGDNYEESLQLLKDRYDKPYYIINAHIKALFDIPPVTKDKLKETRTLIAETRQHLRALHSLNVQISNWDPIIIHLTLQKLDRQTKEAWNLQGTSKKIPTLGELYQFLENRCGSLELNQDTRESKPNPQQYKSKPKSFHITQNSLNQSNTVKSISKSNISYRCVLCNNNHYLFHCSKFLNSDRNDKIKTIKMNQLCFNCLKPNHTSKECFARKCIKCGKLHNTLLHEDQKTGETSTQGSPQQSDGKITKAAGCCFHTTDTREILLATVTLKVKDAHGNWQHARGLLDSGSQLNFVTPELIKKLHIPTSNTAVMLAGINNKSIRGRQSTTLKIGSRINNYETTIKAVVLDEITCLLPSNYINYDNWNMPQRLQLADEEFNKPGPIDILIGAEIYFEIIRQEQIKLGPYLPIMQNTIFGWIISGQIYKDNTQTGNQVSLLVSLPPFEEQIDLKEQIEKFWQLETINEKRIKTKEERECDGYYQNTTRRTTTGNYIVRLPLKRNITQLGSSYESAMYRFKLRLNSNEELNKEYCEFMNEYIQLGHMEVVSNLTNVEEAYYIPHHAVIKKDSTTTKLRVVFNASMKTTTQLSLNDAMIVAPTVCQDIVSIVLRFRLHKFVMVADIEKMYRQILVNPDHQRYQRIIWQDENSQPQIFTLKTVTYGTAAAPYLATRTLRQLAEDEGDAYPLAKNVLINDFYVDDVMTGSNDLNTAIELQSQLNELLRTGGFNLRKWCSNNDTLLRTIEPEKRETKFQLVMGKETVKTLGLIWIPGEDTLKFAINIQNYESTTYTKRSILGEIASIYDPLGLLNPLILKAKLYMQKLWKSKVDWDTVLEPNIREEWDIFKSQLRQVQTFEINRRAITLNSTDLTYELHGFCDSSQDAYGACIYLKAVDQQDNISVELICAKSRVAPLKPITLPRLELCGAVILARLQQRIQETLRLKIQKTYLWTDSTIVLHWIGSEATRWKLFVRNRVSEIQELTLNCIWNHISTDCNPADYLTRGLSANQLTEAELWWKGPQFLMQPTPDYPTIQSLDIQQLQQDELEETHNYVSHCVTITSHVLDRISTLIKAKRIIAYCLRFIYNIRHKHERRTGSLRVNELTNALKILVKDTQSLVFAKEIKILTSGLPIKDGALKTLTPFLDEDKILRVGGRLENIVIDYNKQHPIILPAAHKLTELIIQHEHLKLFHGGTQLILANLRENYWTLRGRSTVRKVILKCITCFKLKAKQNTQLMGNLPAYRGKMSKAFTNTGIDYGGPFFMKTSIRRNAPSVKSYIALFVCMVTRAIHIELVTDLSTQSFLSALKRFLARRGKCQNIYSDNATNFKGAKNQLVELYRLMKTEEFQQRVMTMCANDEINWNFIPPNSPHFGGLWEAGIKTVKYHIQRVIGKRQFTYEEFSTLLTQIEACVNSRPLCPISDDPSEYNYLTPSHFLNTSTPMVIPEPDLTNDDDNRLNKYQIVEKQHQLFWKIWSKDFLNTLQQRTKWYSQTPNTLIGVIILLKEDNVPPCNWVLGRIVEVFPGTDGLVRVVKVKTKTGIYKRPITKCCILPIKDNFEADPSKGAECLG